MPRLVNKSPSYRRRRPSGRALVCIDGQCIYLGKWSTADSRRPYHKLTRGYPKTRNCADGEMLGVEDAGLERNEADSRSGALNTAHTNRCPTPSGATVLPALRYTFETPFTPARVALLKKTV